jgi:hypothetical protein
MDLKGIGLEGVYLIRLAQDVEKWRLLWIR